jgi:hypothetical protein
MRALTALLETVGKTNTGDRPVDILVNGKVVQTLQVRAIRVMQGPYRIDVASAIHTGLNEVSLRSAGDLPVETQFNAGWYEPWSQPRLAKDFTLDTKFSSANVKINDAVTCNVRVSRPAFRGWGMLIAEIGLPPGAEVDRGSLESTLGKVDSYEVAPDHVTFYIWPQARDLDFHFQFRPRFAMKTKMAESVLYDYYNPDARTVLVPGEFTVH